MKLNWNQAYGEVAVYIHAILWTLDGVNKAASRPATLIFKERTGHPADRELDGPQSRC
jgi:hypothetical protein